MGDAAPQEPVPPPEDREERQLAGEPSNPRPDGSTSKVRKRTKGTRQQVAVACLPCQRRKCRCDGNRPICGTCITRKKKCEYNIDEGLSRVGHLKEKNKTLEQTTKEMEKVLEMLRKGSDSEAAAVLARLRVGQSISTILDNGDADPDDHDTPEQSAVVARPRGTGIELDIPAEVPQHLLFGRVFNRDDWGRQDQRRGGHASLSLADEDIGSSHSQQPYRSWTYAAPRQNPTPIQRTAPRATPLMIGYHEAPQEINRLRNFGNMDFSAGIYANHYPSEVQQRQAHNLFRPQWATTSQRLDVDQDHPMFLMNAALVKILQDGKEMIQQGVPLVDIAGHHPNFSAIFDDEAFRRATPLSQWVCRLVYSIKESNRYFVCYASMYLFWWILRWMIAPSPDTYYCIPEFLRPSPTQLFMPHYLPIDFFAWPGFRDYVTRVPEMFDNPAWIVDMSVNIACDCPMKVEEMLVPSPIDGELDLSPEALACASEVSNWSVSPSFRQFLINADKYMRVRWTAI